MQPTSTPVSSHWEVATHGDDALSILINDHVAVKEMLIALNEAAPGQREPLLKRLKLLLTVHNATEENLVYPAIRLLSRHPEESATLYQQTASADVIVWMLSNLDPADPAFETNAADLRDAVLEHVRLEEEQEFPALREAAVAEMAKLTADVREFRHTFGTIAPPAGITARG